MAQYYTIVKVSEHPPKTWEGQYGPMETYKVMLEGVEEPVEVNRKPGNVPKAADALYGEITSTEFGYKFKPASKPFNGGSTAKKEWQPRDDSHIRAQWAIGQAVQLVISGKNTGVSGSDTATVESYAKEFYAMVDRVKGGVVTDTSLKDPGVSGYEKAKQVASTLKPKTSESEAEFASLMATSLDEGTPIDLESIPF